MKIGVVFPQTEIGADPAAVRDFAQATEGLGYDHLLAFDHVIGANAASRPGWSGHYDSSDMFHEIFVLFGYLAALTERIELVTGVVILPQRQTVLVAKQAAEIDVLSGGRFRLGIGVGWNEVEFEALGEDFTTRGARSEEQIAVMRALWASELVTYEGRWHRVTDAGLHPLPSRRSIPIWIGGHADIVLRRTARIADGWMPLIPPDEDARAALDRLRGYAREAGRDPAEIGIESWFTICDRSPGDWLEWIDAWKGLGATHLTLNTMESGFTSPAAHIDAIRRFREAYEAG
jgi:probable F420-dependent oxidoreductase